MYGGIIISMARAISFNGLQNAQWVYAINSGNHCNPTYAGDTIYAYSEILEKIEHKREDIGLLRVRTIVLKIKKKKEIENAKGEDGKYSKCSFRFGLHSCNPKKSTKKKIKFNKKKKT